MKHSNTKLSNNKRNELIRKLIDRFNYDKILNEQYYIKNMSSKMTIKIEKFQKEDSLKHLPSQTIQQILKQIPYFKINKGYIKIQYENADRILIITGIKKDTLTQFIQQWKKDNPRKNGILNQTNLTFWYIIQFCTHQLALTMKKFIRTKKVDKDLLDKQKKQHKYKKQDQIHQNCNSYKFMNRRVRIVLLNQDFFTIIVDLMTQSMNQKFCQAIQSKSDQPILYKGLSYIPLYNIEKIQQRHQQIDDTSNSEILSFSQQIYDPNNRIRDIDIETNNQATQIQINWIENQNLFIETNHKSICQDMTACKSCNNLQSIYQKEGQGTVGSQCQIKYLGEEDKTIGIALNSSDFPLKLSNNNQHKSDIQQKSNQPLLQPIRKSSQQNQKSQHNPTLQPSTSQKPSPLQPAPNNPNDEQQKLTIIQFNEMKKKYKSYLKQHEGFRLITIPEYIRKQSDSETNKKKFYHEIIRRAEQFRDSNKVYEY